MAVTVGGQNTTLKVWSQLEGIVENNTLFSDTSLKIASKTIDILNAIFLREK